MRMGNITSEDMAFFLSSVNRPKGIFELYSPGEIGDGAECRIPFLDACIETYEKCKEYGLAFQYGIHNESIHLQLWTTDYENSFPLRRSENGMIKGSYDDIKRLDELARFSYRPNEVYRFGMAIQVGMKAGPLERDIFQEILRKDKNSNEMRLKIGSSLTSLGKIALEMQQRDLSID